jgi:phosphomevalonate kinase
MMKLRAPGKLFLAGEYAVLEGGPALLCGIDRFLEATVSEARALSILHRPSGIVWDGGPAPEELRFAVRAVQLAKPVQPFRLVYENDFALEGRKLGLGGSAAATVLAVRAARPDLDEARQLSLAAAAHWIEQGGSGSGGDVAACALGGVIEVRSRFPWSSAEEAMHADLLHANPIAARRIPTPPDLRLLLAFAGEPADTRVLVRKVRALEPLQRRRHFQRISRACESLTRALTIHDTDNVLQAVREGAAAMAALGEAAHAPIVNEALARICAIAASAGAAAKPSGAGGGDCAVVFCFGDEALQRAEAALSKEFPTFRAAPA